MSLTSETYLIIVSIGMALLFKIECPSIHVIQCQIQVGQLEAANFSSRNILPMMSLTLVLPIQIIVILVEVDLSNLLSRKPTFTGCSYFIMMGITSILGFNAMMGSLDFFVIHYPGFDAPFYLALPPMVSFNVVSLLMPLIAAKISLQLRLITSLIGMIGFLLLMPLIATTVSTESLSFSLVLLLSLLWGIFGQLFNGSMVGFACRSQDRTFLVSYNIGSSASGIIIILLRIFTTLLYGQDINASTFAYFASASTITFMSLIYHLFYFKSHEYQRILDPPNSHSKTLELIEIPTVANQAENGITIQQQQSDSKLSKDATKITTLKQSKQLAALVIQYFETARWLMPLPLFMLISNINANMMYPGLGLKSSLSGMSRTWSTIWIVFMHNFANVVGKWLSGKRIIYNSFAIKLLVILRFLHLVIFIINAINPNACLHSNMIISMNITIFSLSAGFTDGAIFVLSFEKNLPEKQREHTGFVTAFALTFGIMIGQLVGIPFSSL